MRIKEKGKKELIVEDEQGEILKVDRVPKFNNSNGNSSKELIQLAINEIRENRQEINYIKSKLMSGTGKIAANRQAIIDICENNKIERNKTYLGAGALTIILNAIKEGLIYLWR